MAFSGSQITALRPNALTGRKWGSFVVKVAALPPVSALIIQLLGTETLTTGLSGTETLTTALSGLLES